MTYLEKVYQLVKKIPKGKVTTYGEIGRVLGISPRVVGHALHLNESIDVPCHRIVNKEGRVALNYAFGGHGIQRERLEKEGVGFKDELHVEIEFFMFKF